ncbi:hypothetical protein G7046_g5288 [Stylonectria norvegica]|nr:hypothetical protein G7046_g5288 [Stylonectria norvegica]
MSSMFKKKGGLAFKPKIPASRRPAAPAAPALPAKVTESQVPVDSTPQPSLQSITATPISGSLPDNAPGAIDEEFPNLPRQEAPTQSRSAPEPTAQDDDANDKVATNDALPAGGSQPENKDGSISSTGPTPEIITKDVESTTIAEAIVSIVAAAPGSESQQTATESTTHTVVADITPDTQGQESSPSTILPTPGHEEATPAEPSPLPSTASEEISESAATPTIEPTPEASTAPKTRSRRKPAVKAASDKADDGTEKPKPKRRPRKPVQPAQEGDEAPAKRTRKRKTPTEVGTETPSRKRRVRSVTPEDAETQTVDLQKLKMADLTKDLHIGKKFSRHDELRERERKARLKTKVAELVGGEPEADAGAGSETPEGTVQQSAKKAGSAAPSAPALPSGPQFRIVDGQIVVDQSSLALDRHARAAASQANMETIEENDFTRLITSNSFMNTSKLKGPNIWTDAETELFYRGLRMFGTDFEILSKMFPNKSRRSVKLKYNREERHSPRRIDAALIGEKTIKMDLDEYKAFSGSQFESVESIEAEQRRAQEGFEAEQQRRKDEQDEIMRKKREELFADEDGMDGLGKKKKKKKKGKLAITYGLNGEPINTGTEGES